MSLQYEQSDRICSMVQQHCCNITLWFIPQGIFWPSSPHLDMLLQH